MKAKSYKKTILVLLVLILVMAAAVAGMLWFLNNHFFVEGKAYPNDAEVLNLRNKSITVSEYESLRKELPECKILWDVPFQNTAYPDDTTGISLYTISDQDLSVLAYFPKLKTIDATGCRDYVMLMKLKAQYPDIQVAYNVNIGGQEYAHSATTVTATDLSDAEIALMAYLPQLETVDVTACEDTARIAALAMANPNVKLAYHVEFLGQTFTEETKTATFQNPNVAELIVHLPGLTGLESVHLVEPSCEAEMLLELVNACPKVNITWEKTIFDGLHSSTETEFDFSGMYMENTDAVEAAMKYFPNAEKVIMSDCGLDNETMAAFREKMRPEYKVVWTVYVTKKPIRTDQEVIHSSALKVCFIDELSYDLKYCEDAVIVDIGHSYVKYIDWVQYMPNLKYLILTHNWVKDLSPISSCKNLIYLEIYWNDYIPDYTPLLGCTALKDLNLSGTFADPAPLQQMTWLENLWANATDFTAAEKQALVEALPNTRIEFTGGDYTSKGWRDVPRYFEMRDMMGLGYNTW